MTDVKRVLIYRLASLGDTLIALPALHLIARAFPKSERRMPTNSRERQGSSYRLLGTTAVRCILLRLLRRRGWPFAARNKRQVWFPYGTQHRVLYHKTECWVRTRDVHCGEEALFDLDQGRRGARRGAGHSGDDQVVPSVTLSMECDDGRKEFF